MSKLDDIRRLQSLIEVEFGISEADMFFSREKSALYARKIFCHTVLSLNITSHTAACAVPVSSHFILKYYEQAMNDAKSDAIFVRHLNMIRKRMDIEPLPIPKIKVVELPKIKTKEVDKECPKEDEKKKEDKAKSFTPNPFGIVYTPLDELSYMEAVRSANAYMQKFGKGEQPLKDGYPISRKSSR